MNIWFNLRQALMVPLLMLALTFMREAQAQVVSNKASLDLQVGAAARLGTGSGLRWKSSDPQIAQVFQNGFVVGLKPGQARVSNEAANWLVTVESAEQSLLDPAALKQYSDNRSFMVGNRKCYGSELNGQRDSDPDEKRFARSNRIINPKPLRADKPLEWELQPGTEIYDGAGVLMGTVSSALKIGDRRVPVSMFNYGASKVLNGRIYVYAFSVSIKSSDSSQGNVGTSAWLPLDHVVDKETLLERIGLGKARLPALPLEATGCRVTGGNPQMYSTEYGELSIVRKFPSRSPPVPSHYLRRPSGTINLVYSVPGFGLGGEGTDSFLISDDLEFYPASGAKVFKQPTYFPPKHPQAGKVAPQTMTFLYGAIKTKRSEPTYGWMAKEALEAAPQ